jgi:acyl carrier protein
MNMGDQAVKNKIIELVANLAMIEEDDFELTDTFSEIGLDSIDICTLVADIEIEYDIFLDQDIDLDNMGDITVEKLIEITLLRM